MGPGDDDERLSAFLADAAHELRTPLAIAVGYTGILKRIGTSDGDLTDRIVGDIAVEHERLRRLVDRILQLARLDAAGEPAAATCDAVSVAEQTIALVHSLDSQRTIELEAPPNAPAAIPEDELRDALHNLLDNAVCYAPGAPIHVTIVNNGEVIVRVKDQGPGMDEFTAAHAFDRFFRGADRGEIPGCGLGLPIVRRIVERAGGRAVLDSAPGSGTTIELRLRRSP
jgi:two-component system, OmpR family, sensor kinase